MGDPVRAPVFAEFIGRQFPRAHTILDIAGGGGALSFWLASIGYTVTLIDPRGRFTQGVGPVPHTKAVLSRITILRKPFDASAPGADVIVGMHPDGATLPIVNIADARRCCFAIVPCCIKHPVPLEMHGKKTNYSNWIEFLRHRPKHLETR